MNSKQITKLVVFNTGIVALELLVFSDKLLGFSVTSESTLKAALSITIIIISIGIFVYGNYNILTSPKVQTAYILEELREPKEYIEALESYRYKQAFSKQIDFAIGQIQRLNRKKESLDVAYTTLQMKDAAESGVLDGFIMEYQTYTNNADLKKYIFTPFGVRHDNPVYSIGTLSKEKQEAWRRLLYRN